MSEDQRRGGLPDDDALAAAFSARKRPARRPPEPEPAPVPETPEKAAQEAPEAREEPQAETAPVIPAPAAAPSPVSQEVAVRPAVEGTPVLALEGKVIKVVLPNLGPTGRITMQCAVNVSLEVQERFDAYQAAQVAETGYEPTNAIVVRRAVLAARKADAFSEILRSALSRRQPSSGDEDEDPENLFGEVEGRRSARGRLKTSVQQPFRPSRQELAVIDAIWGAFGFPSRSDFLDATLDWWLPKKRRR